MGFGSIAGGASKPGVMRMDVRGVEELQRALMELKPALQRRVVRGAMSKAARVAVKEVKQNVKVESGTLKRSIGFKVFTGKSGADAGTVMAKIGPRRNMGRFVTVTKFRKEHGARRGASGRFMSGGDAGVSVAMKVREYRKPTKYADLVEKGTVHSPAESFLRKTIDGRREMLLAILRAQIRIGVEREAKKLAAKTARKK